MDYKATWYAGETAISTERASTFAATRDIMSSGMAGHKVRSGATHAQISSPDGALLSIPAEAISAHSHRG